MKLDAEYGKIILRLSLASVFLWFGINQLYDSASWIGFVPDFAASIISAKSLVLLNGSLEVILGLLLLAGIYVRIVAFILGIHLLGISSSLGYSALAIRDFGLALATLSLVFFGPDKWCLDNKK